MHMTGVYKLCIMSALCLSFLLFIFPFSLSVHPIQGRYGMKMNHFNLSEIQKFKNVNKPKRRNEFLVPNHIDPKATILQIPIEKPGITQSNSSSNKRNSKRINLRSNKSSTNKEIEKNSHQPCYSKYEQKEIMNQRLEKEIGQWAVKIRNNLKREMLMKFRENFHLEKDYPNCRNKTCQRPLEKKKGSAICQTCYKHYEKQGEIRIDEKFKSKGKKSLNSERSQKQNLRNKKLKEEKKKRESDPFYKKHRICHDPTCNQPMTEEEKGDFCYSCFPASERIENSNERMKKVKNLIERIKALKIKGKGFSNVKIEILKEFSEFIDLGDCHSNCRNRYCRNSLIGKDGQAICQTCRVYYSKNKKLRGKDKPILKRRPILMKIKENAEKKLEKEMGSSKEQNLKCNQQKESNFENINESIEEFCEKTIGEIPIFSPLAPLPIIPFESFDPISSSDQSSQQLESSLNKEESIIKDGGNPIDLEPLNDIENDMICQVNDYNANDIFNSGTSNDFLEPFDPIIEID